MKFSKLTLAVAGVLSASASASAFAIDLYVDSKTKQIYAEPGPHRVRLGTFEQVDGNAPKKAEPAATAAQAQELAAIKEDLELKTNEIKALEEHAKEASEEPKIELKDGLEIKSKDGNFKANINGRMQVDSQTSLNNSVNPAFPTNPGLTDTSLSDGVGVRRARLGVEGTFYKDFDYKFEYDFTRGNGTVAAGVTDAYIKYKVNKPFSIKFGSFKEPFSLEEATSNRFITFIERNMAVNAFVDNPNTYKVGIGANYATDRWAIATSLQTEPVGQNFAANSATNANGGGNRNNGSGDTGYEVNARVTGLPWFESKNKFWHIGSSGSYVTVNNNYTNNGNFNNGGFGFNSTTNGNVDRTSILNTGNLTSGNAFGANSRQIDHFQRYGGETALVYGPFSAQAEYIQTDIFGKGYSGETLEGYYAYGSFFLTGESRNYKSSTGAWDRIKPNRNFDMKGGWGAWEVALGYDYLNLNDGVINGGRAATGKLGLNWYPNSHIKIMANYIHALQIETASNTTYNANGTKNTTTLRERGFDNADLDMIELRTQVDF